MILKRILLLSFICCIFTANAQDMEYFIKQGLQNSPLLKDYQNQINQSSIDSLLIKADSKPRIDGNAQFLYQPYSDHLGYDNAITNGGNYNALVSVTQVILNRKILESKYKDVSLQKQTTANTFKITTNDVRKLIVSSYLTAYSDYYELSFNTDFLKLIYQQKDILKNLAEKGIYKQTDYLSFLIEIQNQEMQILQLTNQYKKDIHALNQVCGINDTKKYDLVYPEFNKQKNTDISNTPQMFQFRLDSLKLINQRAAIDNKYRPTVSWFADAGFLSSDPAIVYKYPGFSAGLNLNLHLYDGKQRQLNYQKLSIQETTRNYYVEAYKKQYNEQLNQLNELITSNTMLEEQMKKQQTTSNELIDIYKVQLNVGNVSITDMINAVKNYITINRNLNQLKISTLQIINEYNYLMQE